MTELIKTMTGYKATDKDMKCRDHQFELGVWYTAEGELEMCKNGFHFCTVQSGPRNYYGKPGTRIFKVEAEDVLDPKEPGADNKCVARRIRLVEEIKDGGEKNTGDFNTGDYNTGDFNTGDFNTGYCNTGRCNTGDYNTGDYNTGYCNTGRCNTGHRNTGDYNTGYCNTGNRNTGIGNATDRSPWFFCTKEPKAMFFDRPTRYTFSELYEKFGGLINELSDRLIKETDPIDAEKYWELPNWSPEIIAKLHELHLAARKKH